LGTLHVNDAAAAEAEAQGSDLEPILFVLYVRPIADLLQLVKRHRLQPYGYTDDTRVAINGL